MTNIIKFIRNKYVIVLLIAGVWMLFFDRYNLVSQTKMRQQIQRLETDKTFYENGIEDRDYQREKLFNDPEELERFAREKHLMSKKGEDVFIVVD